MFLAPERVHQLRSSLISSMRWSFFSSSLIMPKDDALLAQLMTADLTSRKAS